SDGDGVPDCVDYCPNDSHKVEPGICGCGVPDTDTDGDGVPDCVDLCPNDPFTDGSCTGRCCMPNGACDVITPSACVAASGIYGGDGTFCSSNACPAAGCACSGDLNGDSQVDGDDI